MWKQKGEGVHNLMLVWRDWGSEGWRCGTVMMLSNTVAMAAKWTFGSRRNYHSSHCISWKLQASAEGTFTFKLTLNKSKKFSSLVTLVTVQLLSSQMWLVATVPDSIGPFRHCRDFHRTALVWNSLFAGVGHLGICLGRVRCCHSALKTHFCVCVCVSSSTLASRGWTLGGQ